MRTVANFTRRDAREFLSLASDIPLRTSSESFPITEANQVLKRLKESKIRGAASFAPALITYFAICGKRW